MRLLPIILLLIISCISPLFAEGYIWEDLGTDIYRRVDQGNFKLKKQMIEDRLKGSAEKINKQIGKECWEPKDYCLKDGADFTASELDDLSAGRITPLTLHMKEKYRTQTTDQMLKLVRNTNAFYQNVRDEVDYSKEKLQSVGSIGLFTDGSIDNSSYDLMYDLEQIHRIIFAQEIPYNGLPNMGAESIANMLAWAYDGVIDTSDDTSDSPSAPVPNGGVGSGNTASGVTSLTGLLNSGSLYCPPTSDLPTNLDASAFRDIASQRAIGISEHSSYSLMDNGYLPEYWARIAANNSHIPSGNGSPYDTFGCSATDIFCITVEFIMYNQNLLYGGPAYTIEKILDDSLKIVNKFAGSSFAQSKMTRGFFVCDTCFGLSLPDMIHDMTKISRLPPPILNMEPRGGAVKTKKTEMQEVLVNTFESVGVDYKRQNSIEDDQTALAIANSAHLTTDDFPNKINKDAPARDSYTLVKEMELKKKYYDSFNNDLLQIQSFSVAFTKDIAALTTLIKWMYEIPQR